MTSLGFVFNFHAFILKLAQEIIEIFLSQEPIIIKFNVNVQTLRASSFVLE